MTIITSENSEYFPVMRGDARMATGASYFQVPLFSHVIDNLWQGCSPAEFPDPMRWHPPSCQWLRDGDKPRFDKIINLYPWGEYRVPEGTEKIDVVAYDGHEVDYNTFQNAAILAMDFLDEGHKVLVHCQAGLNRSSFVIALILMEKYEMSADEAIAHIRKSRSDMCLCNEGFVKYLRGLK